MSRLANGDRAAFDPLYAALHPRAWWLARRRLGEAEAADVAQTALLKVFARASEFTPGRACLPWFYAIVANEIRATRRRSARLAPDELALERAASDAIDADAQLLRHELESALEQALRELDGEVARTLAALLGRAPPPDIPPTTFRKRVSRAYARLRLLLGPHHVD